MIKAYFMAIVTASFWGAGFIGSRFGLEAYSPMWVTFGRFIVALLVGLPFLGYVKKSHFTKTTLYVSVLCSILLTGMMFFQIKGLGYTTVAKSGFITIMYAFFTPVLFRLFYKQKLSNIYWFLLTIAMFGMFLIGEMKFDSFNYGDFLTLLSAVCGALHILIIGHFAKCIKNFALFNTLQMFSVSIISLIIALSIEGTECLQVDNILSHPNSFLGIMFMGIFSTAIGFLFQCKTQNELPAHTASLIFLLESPIGAFLAYMIFGEELSKISIIGCCVVTCAVGLMLMEKRIQLFIERSYKRISNLSFKSKKRAVRSI